MFRTIAISALLAATVLPAAAQASDIDQVISAYNEAATSGSREDRVAAARALGAAARTDARWMRRWPRLSITMSPC